MSLSNYLEGALCNHLRGGSAFAQPAGIWAKLHIGDPGEDGTGNPATETTRKQVTFGAPTDGVMLNTGALTWTNVAGTEEYTYVSYWDASTAGNCLGSGPVTGGSVTAGQTWTVAVGQASFTLT